MKHNTEWLLKENEKLRKAGCELAEKSAYVVREFDGLHRLSLAIAKWYQTIGNEGQRGIK